MKELLQKIDDLQAQITTKRPLDETHLASLRNYYRIGLAWSSNALEGNTLTESETKVIIEEGLTVGGKSLREHLEATGHAAAYDHMYSLVRKKEITEADILALHRLFYRAIDEARAGVYRDVQVFISGSRYPVVPPENIASAMAQSIRNLATYRKQEHPVITAAKAHKEFVFIHPFIDGNGRVARLLMNCLLLQEGYSLSIIPPVRRIEYIAALEKAHTDDTDFLKLIAETVYETQKDYLRLLND